MLWKFCTQYASKLGKFSSGHRAGKGQFSFQSQRKAMLKNVQTTIQLHSFHMLKTSLVAQTVKRLSTMRETWVRALHWEDPLEKEMATLSSVLAWRIPWTEEPGGLQSTGLQRVRHDWVRMYTHLTRDRTHIPCIARPILNCWTTREGPPRHVF